MKERTSMLKFLFLGPISIIYGIIISIRNFCYENNIFKSKEFDIPIISIGNISVGGTGKTPHTEFLIRMLQDEFSIAVLSRGYKRKTKGFRLIEKTDTHFEAGDEPLQIKQKFPNTVVAVSESRTKGVEQLRELFPELNLIILDDAFQHRKITPGLSILLNNYNHPIAEDHLLPLGYLREYRSSSHRAHIVIYSKCPPDLKPIERRIMSKEIDIRPYQHLFFSTLDYQNLSPVFDTSIEMPLEKMKDLNILAVSGIAKSKSYIDFLSSKSKSLKHIAFPDHHNFTSKDIKKIEKEFSKLKNEKIIIATEKDAIRLKSLDLFSEEIKKYVYCIPIEVRLLSSEDEEIQFNKQILSYVRNNKRYSKLYKNAYSG